MQDCILTIYCTAYNHGKYIRKTLEGFVNQQTTYPFRVLIHDDASTDNTRQIIEEFVAQYPDLFHPIYQEKNQYSQKVKIYDTFIQPILTTKYTALCEGDDYWCDPQKIQLQLDYMEQHPECSLCVHNTELIREDGSPKGILLNENGVDKNITAEEIIEAGGGGLFHTSSYLYRTEIRNQKPQDFSIPHVGDYPLAMFFAMHGQVHYIGKMMSYYRVGAVGSWVTRMNQNKALLQAHRERELQCLDRIDEITDRKYHRSFQLAKKRTLYRGYLKDGNLKPIFQDPDMRAFWNQNSLMGKCKLLIKAILKR